MYKEVKAGHTNPLLLRTLVSVLGWTIRKAISFLSFLSTFPKPKPEPSIFLISGRKDHPEQIRQAQVVVLETNQESWHPQLFRAELAWAHSLTLAACRRIGWW